MNDKLREGEGRETGMQGRWTLFVTADAAIARDKVDRLPD
jgi:hypothetical protein